jgi:hypothetical protein
VRIIGSIGFQAIDGGGVAPGATFAADRALSHWFSKAEPGDGPSRCVMRYDEANDKYVACEWDEAFGGIGAELQRLAPKSVVFYASGKASLESSYLYSLFTRFYGNNNVPDS